MQAKMIDNPQIVLTMALQDAQVLKYILIHARTNDYAPLGKYAEDHQRRINDATQQALESVGVYAA